MLVGPADPCGDRAGRLGGTVLFRQLPREGQLGLQPRRPGEPEAVRVSFDRARVEETDRDLDGQRRRARVRELCVEVRVEVPESDPPQRRAAGAHAAAGRAGAEERQVGEDVVALVQAEVTAH